MQTVINKWENSLVVRIPDDIAKQINLKEKAPVELFMESGGVVIRLISNLSDISDDSGGKEDGTDITQTRTWQLCGSLEIAGTETQYTVGYDEHGMPVTNYSENADENRATTGGLPLQKNAKRLHSFQLVC